jgi:hypothetical protein
MKILKPEIQLKNKGGLTDLIDNVMKSAYNITDEEYDYICENATDEELDYFTTGVEGSDFSSRKKALEIRNKYIQQLWEQ